LKSLFSDRFLISREFASKAASDEARLPDFRPHPDFGCRAHSERAPRPTQTVRSGVLAEQQEDSMSEGVDNRELRWYWVEYSVLLPAAEWGFH
jgi:hypothetical protein